MTLWIAVRASTVTTAAVLGSAAAVGFGLDPRGAGVPFGPAPASVEDAGVGASDDADSARLSIAGGEPDTETPGGAAPTDTALTETATAPTATAPTAAPPRPVAARRAPLRISTQPRVTPKPPARPAASSRGANSKTANSKAANSNAEKKASKKDGSPSGRTDSKAKKK